MCGCRVGRIEKERAIYAPHAPQGFRRAHTKTDDAYTTEAATSIASRRVASRCRLKPLQCPRIQIQVCSVTTLARATERVRHTQDTPSFKRAWHKADERTRCRPGAQQAQRRRWPPARARARCSRGPRLLITRDARSNTGLFFVLSAQRTPCVEVVPPTTTAAERAWRRRARRASAPETRTQDHGHRLARTHACLLPLPPPPCLAGTIVHHDGLWVSKGQKKSLAANIL